MHDIQFIRKEPEAFDAALKRRGLPPQSAEILKLDTARRDGLTRQQDLQKKRNELAKAIGMAKGKKEDATALLEEAKTVNDELATLEATLGDDGELGQLLASLPNILSDATPDGKDESANQELRRWGTAPTIASPKEHGALGEALKQMDFEQAAVISGSRFVFLKGQLARLERALANFMLDLHSNEYGYTEVVPPYLVKDSALYGTGQLPKFKADLFSAVCEFEYYLDEQQIVRGSNNEIIVTDDQAAREIKSYEEEGYKIKKAVLSGKTGSIKRLEIVKNSRYWLIPTSEVSLTNLVAGKILSDKELPLRFTAYTPCFRSEAGSAGKDTKGMIRQHQFSKVELVSITTPEESWNEHERMTSIAEEVLKRLNLHYRVLVLCSGDTGFGAMKTHDLEVWIPSQNTFREISSVSNCGDFQARRMKARFKKEGEKDTRFLHTLNGSALAVGRCMVAILENYQQADGSITVPEALQPYMGGLKAITPSD